MFHGKRYGRSRRKGGNGMELTPEAVREIVAATVEELRRCGALRPFADLAYTEILSVLAAYYGGGETDGEITEALKSIENDAYYKIIPLNFRYGYSLERIAELFGVDVSTIKRNKKRLCIAVYEKING